ncbi:MAG: hypothetical protein FJW23_04535 [Acidimicrobiia bacterium]|nr:hypothetical protein [Acidimicrobiia bacterium]
MSFRSRCARRAVAALFVLAAAAPGGAQTQFLRGQNVQPVFEGWLRNADGSFTLVFGYLNRNYVEELHVPVGENNFFRPGEADRGQPAYFYTRRQQFVFEVRVPADFGNGDLVWTLTHNGGTSTAIGNLLPAAEIDEGVYKVNRNAGGNHGRTTRELEPNLRPSVEVTGNQHVSVTFPGAVSLTVAARDDGEPGPRPGGGHSEGPANSRGPGPEAFNPTLVVRQGGPISQDLVKAAAAYETGLAITWLHYRGAGTVTFEPQVLSVPKHNGTVSTTARFSAPGTYVLRAVADDGVLKTSADVTVTVQPEK